VRRTIRLRRGDYRMTDRLTAADIRGRFLSWIDRDDRRPFFAFLNVFDAHEPYYPPGDFGFPFARRAAPVYHWNFNRAVAHAPEELTDLRDSYDSCIRYLDAQLEALVKALDTRGLMRNTIIIVTADHGETIGDHENTLIGHENSVYFDVLQVPLVIYVPSRTGGTRVNAPVSLADVPHTIVDLVSGSRARNPFPGRTVVPSDAQSTRAAPEGDTEVTRPIVSQANPAKYHQNIPQWPIHDGPLFSAVEDRWHFVVDAKGHEQLFDLANDPWERINLVGAGRPSSSSEDDRAHDRLRALLAPVVARVTRSR